jgi:hypothetical protein
MDTAESDFMRAQPPKQTRALHRLTEVGAHSEALSGTNCAARSIFPRDAGADHRLADCLTNRSCYVWLASEKRGSFNA